MIKLSIRLIIAVVVSLLLTAIGVRGNSVVVQTLFTVLGIVFSIAMSLLVSFRLSEILNNGVRLNLRASINKTRNCLLLDFCISSVILVLSLLWNGSHLVYEICWLRIDIMLFGVCVIAMSLLYEIYNFRRIHKLHTDIEDAIVKEKTT